jgi:hypothetical protein
MARLRAHRVLRRGLNGSLPGKAEGRKRKSESRGVVRGALMALPGLGQRGPRSETHEVEELGLLKRLEKTGSYPQISQIGTLIERICIAHL